MTLSRRAGSLFAKRLQSVLSTTKGREVIGFCLQSQFVERLRVFVFGLGSAFGDEVIGFAQLRAFHFFVGGCRNHVDEILLRDFSAQIQNECIDPVTFFFWLAGHWNCDFRSGIGLTGLSQRPELPGIQIAHRLGIKLSGLVEGFISTRVIFGEEFCKPKVSQRDRKLR